MPGMLMYGPISFPGHRSKRPSSLQKMTTRLARSKMCVPGSSGNPTYAADQALLVYYVTQATEVKNARIRWATRLGCSLLTVLAHHAGTPCAIRCLRNVKRASTSTCPSGGVSWSTCKSVT